MANTSADQRTDVSPEDIPAPGWRAVLKRTIKEFQNDNLTDWGAALTYYSVLALFPALIVLIALVGLFGHYPQTTNDVIDTLKRAGADARTVDNFKRVVNGIVTHKGGAGA